MTEIRPFAEADLPPVADLLAAAFTTSYGPAGWQRFLRVSCWRARGRIPSFPRSSPADDDGAVFGFIGTNVRRATFDGRPIRLACTAHLAVAPGSRGTPVGAFLLRRVLGGAQDATITDTANEVVLQLLESLGGRVEPLRSLVVDDRPAPAGVDRARRRGRRPPRRRRAPPVARRRRAASTHPAAGRGAATWSRRDSGTGEPLDASTFLRHLDDVAPAARLRLAYDADYLAWLFDALEQGGGRRRHGAATHRPPRRPRARLVGLSRRSTAVWEG